MQSKFKHLIRLSHTLYDIGFFRLKDRLIYEIKIKVGKFLPFESLVLVVKYFNQVGDIKFFLNDKFTFKKPKNKNYEIKEIKFKLINKEVTFSKRFSWNDTNLDRLWIFNLHYFDWARNWLDKLIDNKKWEEEANLLEYLMDYWISSNNLKTGDGWHSYTISLRIRNWMWLFQLCPELFSQKRINSLWNQFCWLNFNQEKCHGGNHYLENLITLVMVGMQFKDKHAQNISSVSLAKLQIELSNQILEDGGHEERSASYHNLILDRLVELACLMEIIQKESPTWLNKYIKRMVTWSESIRLFNGNMPLFNDSSFDPYYQIDKIINFSRAFLSKKSTDINGLRGKLLNIAFGENYEFNSYKIDAKLNKTFLHLPNTGWVILRPGEGWELIFKCGKSCPSHLAAHAHSDLLSFDLFHKGIEIICETATSTYSNNSRRYFERSSAAHNTMLQGKMLNGKFEGVEPIDTWSSFRAGKKAKHKNLKFGSKKGWLWVQGSHDGFKSLGGDHLRWLTIKIGKDKNPILLIIDSIKILKGNAIESYFHFSPIFNNFSNYRDLNFKCYTNLESSELKYQSFEGYYSAGFGLRTPRKSIKYSLSPSKSLLAIFTIFSEKSLILKKRTISVDDDLSCEIDFGDIGKIIWDIKLNNFYIN